MSQEKHSIRVSIYGTEYPIEASEEPEYILEIARYVDERMRSIPGHKTAHSLASVAILTALNIADELYREREKTDKQLTALNDQISGLIRRIDQALESPDSH